MNIKIMALLLIALFSQSCTEQSIESYDQVQSSTNQIDQNSAHESLDQADSKIDKKLIRRADLRFQVESIEESYEYMLSVITKNEGYISTMNETRSNQYFENHVSIKVPSSNFDNLIEELQSKSLFTDFKKLRTNDVSFEYIDIHARLETKKRIKDRFIEVLRTKTGTVEDILEAEERINSVEEEIESVEARLKYIDHQVKLSTIDLQMYQELPESQIAGLYYKSFGSQLKEGFLSGWSMLQEFVLLFVSIWPILCLLLFLYLCKFRVPYSMFKRLRS